VVVLFPLKPASDKDVVIGYHVVLLLSASASTSSTLPYYSLRVTYIRPDCLAQKLPLLC